VRSLAVSALAEQAAARRSPASAKTGCLLVSVADRTVFFMFFQREHGAHQARLRQTLLFSRAPAFSMRSMRMHLRCVEGMSGTLTERSIRNLRMRPSRRK
jgi:hypothetical protein